LDFILKFVNWQYSLPFFTVLSASVAQWGGGLAFPKTVQRDDFSLRSLSAAASAILPNR
jgi:hypothetical protein